MSPSTHGADGTSAERDSRGRFVAGNTLGRGNPLAGAAAKFRAELFDACREENAIPRVVASVIARAVDGDMTAARLLFEYVLGKPIELDILQRVEELEELLLEKAGRQ